MYPMVANIEMRPCLISVARRRLKSSTLPLGGKSGRIPETHGAPARRVHSRMRAKEMLCSWPSLPRRFRSDHPGTWKLWQRSKHRVAASRLLMILEKWWYGITWYNMIWNDMVWYDIIWFDIIWYDIKMKLWYMLWRDMICNRQPCVYTICLINKMDSIKSANVMSLCMIRRHYISMVQSVHVTSWKIFIPGTFYNPPTWQVYV